MHQLSNPSILYFGTPVILISTTNEDGTYNLAPISSVFWLGYRCVIGISASSMTTENILREKECVINLPSEEQVTSVNRLALTTGSKPVPDGKLQKGYCHVNNKFKYAGLTKMGSTVVRAPRVAECPVHLEATLMAVHPLAAELGVQHIKIYTLELKIVKVHLDASILKAGCTDHIDPDKWRPLIMNFQEFYGLGKKLHRSDLASIPEHFYRNKEVEAAGQ